MSSSESSSSVSDADLDVSKDSKFSDEDSLNEDRQKRIRASRKKSNLSKKAPKNRLTYTDSEEELLMEEEKGKKPLTKKTEGILEQTGNLADYEYVVTPEKSSTSGQNITVDEDSESELEMSVESESEESGPQKKRSKRERSKKEEEDLSSEESLEEFFTEYSKKDKNRLTSRQRAKLDDDFQVELLELPTESKKKSLTAEELALKRSETARRRKNQSERRAEQDKMDTINKLLKKQASRRTKKDDDEQEQKDREVISPTKICYLQNKDGVTVSFPVDVNPIQSQKFTGYPPSLPQCSIPGCDNVKKYKHPKLLKDVCSLEHYRMLEA